MKFKYPTLDNIVPTLVAFVAASIVGMTFTNYVICNFKVMSSLHYLYLVKAFSSSGEKPPSKCDDNTSESIQTLMSLLATIIALKADLRKKPAEKEDE
jgi:hypothetical protein